MMKRNAIILLSCAASLAAIGQLLFRVGARGRESLVEFFNLPILAGLVLYALGTMIWIFVLSREALVDVYAFTALTFVVVYFGSIFILHEHFNIENGVGVLLVLFGLYLITRTGSIG